MNKHKIEKDGDIILLFTTVFVLRIYKSQNERMADISEAVSYSPNRVGSN